MQIALEKAWDDIARLFLVTPGDSSNGGIANELLPLQTGGFFLQMLMQSSSESRELPHGGSLLSSCSAGHKPRQHLATGPAWHCEPGEGDQGSSTGRRDAIESALNDSESDRGG